jgi:hypothetical protein
MAEDFLTFLYLFAGAPVFLGAKSRSNGPREGSGGEFSI